MYFNRKLLQKLISTQFTPSSMHPKFIRSTCIIKTSGIELSSSRCTVLLPFVDSTHMLIAIQYSYSKLNMVNILSSESLSICLSLESL